MSGARSGKKAVVSRRELEAQLRQAQKMNAIGQFAAGIAHDFNNLMTIIVASCDDGMSAPGISDDVRGRLEDIRNASASASALTAQLMTFIRRPTAAPRRVNVNDVVGETARLLARLFKKNIDLQLALDPQLGPIVADAVEVQQVLINLAVNARDAMPDGGRLVIQTRNATVNEEGASRLKMPTGSYVLLAVSDTGRGMDGGTLARLFQPFFTTKTGYGTGLGLSTVHGIVERANGFISVCSEVGRGATFRIYFPRVEPARRS